MLQPNGTKGFTSAALKYTVNEGSTVEGVNWVPVKSSTQLNDFFVSGMSNKTTRRGDIKRVDTKASQLFELELTQATMNPATGEDKVLISKFSFLNLPASDTL